MERGTERSFPELPRLTNMTPRWPGRSFDSSTPDRDITFATIGVSPDGVRGRESCDSSSAGSFIQYVRKAVEQKFSPPSNPLSRANPHNLDSLPPMVPHEYLSPDHAEDVLPSRRSADSLMALYWQYIHSLYPFVGKTLTEADYASLWRGDGPVGHERSFLCLLDVMFALASQFSLSMPSQHRQASAAVFFARAKRLLDLEIAASVRQVQILLLFGLYLQSTNEPHQCWIYVGLAIRIAQNLELYRPETSARIPDPHYRNIVQKVWHGCVLMDRVLAMTYGRPCMISRAVAESVPRPVPVEAEYILLETSIPQAQIHGNAPTRIDFFNQSLGLYDLVFDILTNFYLPGSQHDESFEDVYQHYFGRDSSRSFRTTILDVDHKLVTWNQKLPLHLQISSGEGDCYTNSMLRRQAVVLHQRYVVFLYLLHRRLG